MSFKERCEEREAVLKMTPQEVADEAGISVQTYNRLKRVGGKGNSTTLASLAVALQTTSSFLSGATDDPAPLKIERLSYHAPGIEANSDAIFKLLEREARLIVEEREIVKREQEVLRKQREILEGKNNST